MNTSYFSKSGNLDNTVSIAGKAPDGFKGRQYKKLAPKFWFYDIYKRNGDEIFYRKMYKQEVLDKLDAKEVYDELGEDSILLCWEGKDKFCHRHLVAEWFKEKLNIDIKEL